MAVMLFVVFGLPYLVTPVQLDESNASSNTPAPAVVAKPSDSPFADAQLARERKQAQAILGNVLQLQDQLEGQEISKWGEVAYKAALDTATQADEFYRQREFTTAQAHYQSALQQLQALKQEAETALLLQLERGAQAIQDNDSNAAKDAFALALAIDPNNAKAQQGLTSANALDSILTLLRQGRLFEKTGHWKEALEQYEQALALDAQSPLAQQTVADLTIKIRDKNFTDAMSSGYKALENHLFEQARTAFTRAGQLKPNESSVKLALQQVATQSTQSSIQHRLQTAQQAETDERWQEANQLYASVLAIDGTVMDALVGKLRTDARAQLELRAESVLANPLELNKADKLAAAEQTLADLQNLGKGGARLESQRAALQHLIEKAGIPRQVILQSDNLTQVTIYHVGRIGAFDEHALELKPGHYVAVGSRHGYRDVRAEFTINLEATSVIVNIRCTDKIALGS